VDGQRLPKRTSRFGIRRATLARFTGRYGLAYNTRVIRPALVSLALAGCCGCGRPASPLPAAVASRPAADRLPANNALPAAAAPQPATARNLKWEEIDLPLGSEARLQPWMITTALKSHDGRPVRITGYMYGDLFQTTNVREFKLIRHVDCQFGAVGHPAHLIFIELVGDLRTSFTTEPVTVEGTFHIRPFSGPDGRTWALYHMDVTKIKASES
jgi:hypothetical protein